MTQNQNNEYMILDLMIVILLHLQVFSMESLEQILVEKGARGALICVS